MTHQLYPSRRRVLWLAGVALVYAVALVLYRTDLGVALMLVTLAVLAVLDWRGLTTLAGLIDWSRIHGKRRGWLVAALVCFASLLPLVYLPRALTAAWRAYQRERREAPARIAADIAAREREMGMR